MIFGQGNVAVDVARILLTPVELLKVALCIIMCTAILAKHTHNTHTHTKQK